MRLLPTIRHRPRLSAATLALALFAGPRIPAHAEPDPDAESQGAPRFEPERQLGGKTFLLLGAGARKPNTGSNYTIALWVEQELAHRAFPALAAKAKGRTRDKLVGGDRAPTFVVWGDFEKHAEIRFAESTSAESVRAAFEEGLQPLLGEKTPPELKDRIRTFLSQFDRDLGPNDRIVIHTMPGGESELVIAGQKREVPTDARLQRGIWEIWLGGRPVSNELRRALVDRIEVLGK